MSRSCEASTKGTSELRKLLYRGLSAVSRKAVDSVSFFESAPLLHDFRLNLRVQGDDEVLLKRQVADLATLDFEYASCGSKEGPLDPRTHLRGACGLEARSRRCQALGSRFRRAL